MQPTTITLAVDVANDGDLTSQEFVRIEDGLPNRSTYRGPGNSLSSKDTLNFYRTYPKRSGDFLGSAKVSTKFTQDVVVKSASGLDTVYPLIAETTYSIPVGCPDAVALAFRQRVSAIADREDILLPLTRHLDV